MGQTMTEDHPRPPAPEGAPTCHVCGCWEYDACWSEEDGTCSWVHDDLCSHCAPRGETEMRGISDFLAFLSRQGVSLVKWDRMRQTDSEHADNLLAIYDQGEDGPEGFRP